MGLAGGSILGEAVTFFKQLEYVSDDWLRIVQANPLPAVEQLNLTPFHWHLEFPEVFLNGRSGFDGFVGNPPFMGGRNLTSAAGDVYTAFLRNSFLSSNGGADLCAYFFVNAFDLLKRGGTFGLIATNTISQGDTREASLDHIVGCDGEIYSAVSSTTWPGAAAVYISRVHIFRGNYAGKKTLNDNIVDYISALLDKSENVGNPFRLEANSGQSFQGSIVLGKGFLLTPAEASDLLGLDERHADVIFPYLNGRDINQHPHKNRADGSYNSMSDLKMKLWNTKLSGMLL